ncbi:TetR/AcrR family transcriptional regulator [Mycobacteroides abscessus subsp. massiliense]|uniref:TetR/AcrR family transcriptional regulator n=1 Tax=Mycobacteroides abscessus TaxID=36809 RepID=UPI000F620E63|nr:TetR/AcrR family transcriptional regulator [Mycobacteroides abscessus subsp. massiliense]
MLTQLGSSSPLDPTTQRIVTAARICFTELGFAASTMQRIAEVAEVGVATVYRKIGHRQNLVRLAIIDEAIRVWNLVYEIVEKSATAEQGIVDVFVAFVHESSSPRLFTRSIRESPEAAELASFLSDGSVIAIARSLIADNLDRWRADGQLPADLDTTIAGEIIARLVMSLIETPESVIPIREPDRAREFAQRYLLPIVLSQAPEGSLRK